MAPNQNMQSTILIGLASLESCESITLGRTRDLKSDLSDQIILNSRDLTELAQKFGKGLTCHLERETYNTIRL